MTSRLRCLFLGAFLLLLETAKAQRSFVAHPPNSSTEKSHRIGSDWGDRFDDAPGDGSVLSGFVVHLGSHGNSRVVSGLEPIYLGPKGRVVGNLHGTASSDPVTIDAKPGYSLSGLGIKAGVAIDGFQVFFMRILPSGAGLDPADFYASDWIGGPGGEDLVYLGNDGRLVLGFYGGAQKECNGLGLVQASPASLDPPPVQTIVADDASHYGNVWEGAPSISTGFGPWVFASSDKSRTNAVFGIGSSTGNGKNPPSGGIDVGGKSWMMRTAADQAVTATRVFSGGPLRPGQQFCLRMDNGYVEAGGSVGFVLQNAAGADLIESYFLGGTKNYRLRCNGAELDTGVPFTADGMDFVVTMLSGNHALFDIRTGGGQFATIPCVLGGSDAAQVKLYCRKAGADPANAAFWNGLAIRQPISSKTGSPLFQH